MDRLGVGLVLVTLLQSSFVDGLTKKSRDAGTTPGQYSTAARRPGVVLSGPSRPIRSS